MSDIEKSKLLVLLSKMHQEDQKRYQDAQKRTDELMAQLANLQESLQASLQESRELRIQLSDVMKSHKDKEDRIGSLEEQLGVYKKNIRPLAGERKNSLFFGNHRMAEVSAVYHTIISTCRMHEVSILDYFKKFFQAIMQGRRDYANLLPMTIGLTLNK